LDGENIDNVFRERIKNYLHKALAESKANTNWVNPNQQWLKACDHFVESILDRQKAAPFWDSFLPFATDLAWRGMNLSLAQVVLKMTSPGVPDFYQGTELWDFSLVDPDNRRPVDYALRQEFLKNLDEVPIADLLTTWKDGRIKLRLIRSLLRYRRKYPELFSHGTYTPLQINGPAADSFVAFLRQQGSQQLLVAVRIRLGEKAGALRTTDGEETILTVPGAAAEWHDLLAPRKLNKQSNQLPLDLLMNNLPVSVLTCSFENSAS
jgi:(1->4)-alpha-D-glucan 1-alpha-D-glucosylmutase